MDTVWVTVDRLVHDLGAIRAFVDEAEAAPEVVSAPQVGDVRGAMEKATDAISRIFSDSHDPQDTALQAAWLAIARAQDAMARARMAISEARTARDQAEQMRELTRAQHARALEQGLALSEQAIRLRRRRRNPTDVLGKLPRTSEP